MPSYNAPETEQKWQKRWEESKLYQTDLNDSNKPKYYSLVMFPYPSGDKLHIGHWYNYAPADSWARYMRLKGYNVFEPMGYDSFGLPAENYAIKTGIHPADSTAENIKTMTKQLQEIGTMYDWSHTLATSTPEYYKWTQWIFLQFYKKGLAYKKEAPVNWCPSCQTVLANEQVIDGHCERCKSEVTKKNLSQWFLKIRDYAERLLDFTGLDWPEKTKLMQEHWIGRSEGSEIIFPLEHKFHFVLLHGFQGSPKANFFPWLKKSLEDLGHTVSVPQLPHSNNPTEDEQVNFVLGNEQFDENTILFGHSLGSVVALKVAEKLNKKIAGLVLSAAFIEPIFLDHARPFENTFKWQFNFEKVKENVGFMKVIADRKDPAVSLDQVKKVAEKLDATFIECDAEGGHFDASIEPVLFENVLPSIKIFTTRADTLFGCTYMVLAPEHPLVEKLTTPENRQAVSEYIEVTKHKNDIERSAEGKEKTGVFTGSYALNPVNGKKVPIWLADYVLATYGTGAVMAVPAHDERDFEFTKKYNLPLVSVIKPIPGAKKEEIESNTGSGENASQATDDGEMAFTNDGILFDSAQFSGLISTEARKKITGHLAEKDLGKLTINYKLRDWLISRQRYWGVPIPILYCEKCGEVPVPEKDLPVELPRDVDFKPKGDGKSPLNTVASFTDTTCPNCQGPARREVDTMDTFVDSSWYFLRYPCTDVTDKPFDKDRVQKWLPVDMYIGGPEHACMHLLYARFFNMVLYDMGFIPNQEPFKRLVHQGMITKDGAKMSKSKGNVVSPDEYVQKYGSDIFRMYLMFMGPFTEGGDWNDQGITGIARFVERFFTLMSGPNEIKTEEGNSAEPGKENYEILKKNVHKTIKRVHEDIEKFQFNTCVAAFMEFVNSGLKTGIDLEHKKMMLKLIAPFAPHLAEELWEINGLPYSIFNENWPEFDPTILVEDTFALPIQVNGKLRGQIIVRKDLPQTEIIALAKAEPNVSKYLSEGQIVKEIYVKNKLLNFVVKS